MFDQFSLRVVINKGATKRRLRRASLFFFLLVPFLIEAQTTFMVPMRDSVRLATSVYLPPDTSDAPVPLVLVRTPYGRGPGGALQDSLLAHGIGYVSQDTRGRGDSEGVDSLFLDNGWGEKQDGFDTVEWLAEQPWCNGKIGVYGGSAYGITAYLCAGAVPPHLVCGMVAHCASNLYKHAAFPGGCYRKEQVDTWYLLMGLGYMIELMEEHYIYDSVWMTTNLEDRFEVMTVPFYHVAGWYDTFCEGNIDAFTGLQASGGPGALGNQKLIVGPWTHGAWDRTHQGDLYYPENSLWDITREATRWFSHFLKGEENGIEDEPPVLCYLMGECGGDTAAPGNDWVELNSWPPQTMSYDTLFFQPDKGLLYTPPTVQDTGLTYFHNPDGPMYNNGGRNLIIPAGPKNQFLQDISPHGVTWTSEVLTEAVTLMGRVKARIFLSSDCVDTDVMVRLSDVYPNGTAYLVMDGALQVRFREGVDHEVFMVPGEVYELEVDLGNIAIVFAPGHRIRVGVSSALYPRYEANPNTGEPFRRNTYTRIANNTVHTDAEHPSSIILPVVSEYLVQERIRVDGGGRILVYPNPFSLSLRIQVPFSGEIVIYDIGGRRVGKLRRGESLWRPSLRTPPGLYFIRIRVGDEYSEEKVLYLK